MYAMKVDHASAALKRSAKSERPVSAGISGRPADPPARIALKASKRSRFSSSDQSG
jgi:hypothetical protein